MPPGALLPPGVDSAEWSALNEAVKKQPAPRGAASLWRTHARLASALSECTSAEALVLAHDSLVLPWFCAASGTWRNVPRAAGVPDCVKRFLCAPSLAAFQEYEAALPPKQRHFYECLRERTPVRYWLDLDLTALDALQTQLGLDSASAFRDALACLLERHVIDALLQLFMVERRELQLLLVDGNGDSPAQKRVSLHAIVHGALLPDNEGAAAAVRLAVIDRIKARGGDGSDPTAAALLRCVQLDAVIDRVNTRNRLRRLTGHTKIGQDRHSKPLTSCEPLPPGAYFVSGAAAGGRERLLSWRASALRAPLAAAPLAPRTHASDNAAVQPHAAAAIEAECLAISQVRFVASLLCSLVRSQGSRSCVARPWTTCCLRRPSFRAGLRSPRAATARGGRTTAPTPGARQGRCTAARGCTPPSTATAWSWAARRRATCSARRFRTRTPLRSARSSRTRPTSRRAWRRRWRSARCATRRLRLRLRSRRT